ncbi:DHS-like NAD/FAD-binding domain-containing protein [Phellopilus nigrolimitatus]|nr:DHS-like NAD/FAD-binding domain-containing protein [Phellopilus nigrolimitatus]
MRISVPTIPTSLLAPTATAPPISKTEAVERISAFLSPGNAAVLTGAGVSVDSGIRAYRGANGRYMNPNYKPILYHEVVQETDEGSSFRQRYWLRSFLGYPSVRDALPNTTHFAIAALQHTSHISRLITQNVDGLHNKAVSSIWTPSKTASRILELHGTLHKVSCKNGHVVTRNVFQDWLAHANPRWSAFADELARTGRKLRTNPDGDVQLEEGASYDDFVVPDCPACLREHRRTNIHKPHLIFFGESISREVKDRSYQDIELADRLFIVGTTLATYSAFRLLKHALELGKPVLLLNVGPTRADALTPGVEKISLPSGSVLRDVVRALTGSQAAEDPVLAKFLSSGVVMPPTDDADVEGAVEPRAGR